MLSATVAAWVIGAHLITAQPMPGMSSETPGLYATHQSTGIGAGALRNGNGHVNVWVGHTWQTAEGRFALTLGAVHGVQRTTLIEQACKRAKPSAIPRPCWLEEHKRELLPLLAPSMRLPLSTGTALRVSAWPVRTDAGTRGAAHLSFEARL